MISEERLPHFCETLGNSSSLLFSPQQEQLKENRSSSSVICHLDFCLALISFRLLRVKLITENHFLTSQIKLEDFFFPTKTLVCLSNPLIFCFLFILLFFFFGTFTWVRAFSVSFILSFNPAFFFEFTFFLVSFLFPFLFFHSFHSPLFSILFNFSHLFLFK